MSTRARALGLALTLGLALVLLGVWASSGSKHGPTSAVERGAVAIREGASESDLDSDRASASSNAGFAAGSHEPEHRVERSRVAARVIDADEGPLGEGSVVLGCPDGTSIGRAAIGEEGWFEAPACPSSHTCARLVHSGSVQREPWRLSAGESVELEVEPAPRVGGQVFADGRAFAAAQVIVRRGDRRWTGSSDLDGAFMVALAEPSTLAGPCEFEASSADADFELLVLAAGWRPWVGAIPARGDEALSIALAEPAPALTGRLEDPQGRAFSRARVLVTSRERPDEAQALHPDEAGRFEARGLGDGIYQLRALRDGLELALAQAEAGADVVMASTRSARGPTLELQVRDERGLPMPAVRVDGGPFTSAKTDAMGRVFASDVFAGAIDLRLRPANSDCGVSRESIEIPAGEQGETIRLELALACEPD